MLRNYLKIAFRNLLKHRGYTAINLVGLSLGLTSGIMILLFVIDEVSYDDFHAKADRIYRVNTGFIDVQTGEYQGAYDNNAWPVGKMLNERFPEVEDVTYMRYASNMKVNHEGKMVEERAYFADNSFLNIFSFPLLEGNANNALAEPNSIVITQSVAEKYFGDEPVYGNNLTLGDGMVMVVKGVMDDVPTNSHMKFDMLVSFATFENINSNFSYDGGWGNINIRNYILLAEGADVDAFTSKAGSLYMDEVGEMMRGWGMEANLKFDALRDIYLRSSVGNGMGSKGDISQVYLVSGIALFVILLACINFVNLSTARSVHRAKEVGLRKVVGSTRGALVGQFLMESLLITLLAFFASIILIDLSLPYFNVLINKQYTMSTLFNVEVGIGILSLLVAITLLAGYYPAIVLSGARPALVLKGRMQTSTQGVRLRRGLVVFQFFVSSALVIGTLIVLGQLRYMQNADLGFDKEQVLVVNSAGVSGKSRTVAFQAMKNEIAGLANVKSVSYANAYPGRRGWSGQIANAEGAQEGESVSTEYLAVDEHYQSTLGLELVSGRFFDPNRSSDMDEGLVINETAVSLFGWESPAEAIGKKIESPSSYPSGTVIGVVKDYHHYSLQEDMVPVAMDINPNSSFYYIIRFETGQTDNLMASLTDLWSTHFDGYAFDYRFLDEDYARQYESEQALASVFTLFAGVTILIAIIGLVGLMSFIVVSRSKEIGVRKVLGAGAFNITKMLSKEFIGLVIIANVLAVPLLWHYGNEWLANFAYRTNISPWLFVATVGVTLGIALLTVGYQTFKAGRMNPVDVLKDE